MIAASEAFFAKDLGGRYQADMPEAVATRLAEITVDPATVVLAQAPSEAEARMPRPTPVRTLTPGETKYDITVKMGANEMAMKVVQTITKTDEGYIVKQVMSSPMGDATDEVTLVGAQLSPKHRTATQGPVKIELDYTDATIKGGMEMGPNTQPVNVTLDGPLFADGAAEPAMITTLPLAEGYTTILRGLGGQTMQPELKRLTVTGMEEVETPSGKTQAFRVEVKPADGSAGETVYYVEQGGAHRLLKSRAVVPAMGGAVMEMVLVE